MILKNIYFTVLMASMILVSNQYALGQSGTPINYAVEEYAPFSTAVPFVGMSPDPRTGALGNTGISSKANTSSPFWSVAKTTRLEEKYSAGLNYTPLLSNLQIDNYFLLSFSGTMKFENNKTISLFSKYINMERYDITNAVGERVSQVKPFEMMVGIGYAMPLTKDLSAGISAKYIRSNLAPGISSIAGYASTFKAINAVALDLSLDYEKELSVNDVLNLGISISNLGNKVDYLGEERYSYLPANLGIGIGYEREIVRNHVFRVGLDINKYLVPTKPINRDTVAIKQYYQQSIFSSWVNSFADAPGGVSEELREIIVNLGGEYRYKKIFFARIGYIYNDVHKFNSSSVTLGLGARWSYFDFNISYNIPTVNQSVNTSPLANSLRFGINFRY